MAPQEDSDRREWLPGNVLSGRYRLTHGLGTGGMAQLWAAEDTVLGREVAVKLPRWDLGGDLVFRERLRREARVAALLAHPRVASVHDLGEAELQSGGHVPYIVMELLRGETLAAQLARETPPHEAAVRIATELCDALVAIHAAGVVHGDVKPSNVFLTSNGVKLIDFGISWLGDADQGLAGPAFGTPPYTAPEVLVGGPVTPATDIYALGALLTQLGLDPGECGAVRSADRPAAGQVASRLAAGGMDRRSGRERSAVGPGSDAALDVASGVASWAASGPVAGNAADARTGEAGSVSPADGGTRMLPPRAWLPSVWMPRVWMPPAWRRGALWFGAAATVVVVAVIVSVMSSSGSPQGASPARPSGPGSAQPAVPPGTPSQAGTMSAGLDLVRANVENGQKAGEIRPDVALDLENVIGNLRRDAQDGNAGAVAARVRALQNKIKQRRGEGAITPARAQELSTQLAAVP